jgi:hypothetical protein
MKVFDRYRTQCSPGIICCLGLAISFLASRLCLAALGVKPDINHFYNHWQYLDINLLRNDLATSISLLHSQPPLWNAVLGLLLRLAGGEEQGFVRAFIVFSTTISFCNAFIIYWLLRKFMLPLVAATGASCVYIFGSSAYFYESYIFYPLFTSFLVLMLVASAAHGFTTSSNRLKLASYALSCFCLLALSLTWSLFHPLFVILTSTLLLACTFKRGSTGVHCRSRRSLLFSAVFAFTVLATFVNPLKNMVLFDHLGNGSWVGMNLSQVAPGAPKECGFGPLSAEEIRDSKMLTSFTKQYTHPSISLPTKNASLGKDFNNYNHIGFISRSKQCREIARNLIARNPKVYLRNRIRQFTSSHELLSDSYFFRPIGMKAGDPARKISNWRNAAYLPVIRGNGSIRHLGPTSIPLGMLAGGLILFFSPPFRGSLPPGCAETLLTGLWIMCWLYLIGYGFNGGEQERMRFTIEPLFIAWLSILGYFFVAYARVGGVGRDG